LTPQNARRQYQLARQLLAIIKTEIVGLFSFIHWTTVLAAQERSHSLGILFLPILMLAIFSTIAVYFMHASKAR
jgi:hypothetical protein